MVVRIVLTPSATAHPNPPTSTHQLLTADRLTHRVHILEANGESYRLKEARKLNDLTFHIPWDIHNPGAAVFNRRPP